jgi:hypothetical protein
MPKEINISNKRFIGSGLSLAEDEGAVRIVGSSGEDLMTIAAGTALSESVTDATYEVALQTVGAFTKSLLVHASEDPGWATYDQVGSASVNAAVQVLKAFTDDDVEPRKKLQRPRALAVKRAAGDVVGMLMTAAYERDLSDDELEMHAQAAVDTFRVLLSSGSALQIAKVADAVDPPGEDDAIDLEEARARARLRLHAMYRKLIVESVTVRQMREDWGLSRQRVGQLRDENKLFAVKIPYHRELFHPRWQFTLDHRPRPEMPELLKEAQAAGLDAVGLHQLMTGERSGRPSGVQLLDAGRADEVVALIRAVDR